MTLSLDDLRWNALEAVQEGRAHEVLGTLHEAAEAAGVKPGTLRVWMSRGKLKPLFGDPGGEVFHIPTVVEIAKAGRARNVPKDPAANARGPHRRRTELPNAA
ncbi:MerR family transcriptional regulator [Streptomyces tuirus]|uniref:MerR family transcriptional regulator n=1 Tax=Streptomyces tuirus TaxID=68278 RepID=A0A941F8I1_9ACTN|nr:MerR family transcriptional regulator [Streptomyces tuirus]